MAGAGLTLLGDVFLNKSHLDNHGLLALGMLFYLLGVIPVAIAFKKIEFGPVFLIWEAVTVILALIIASIYFKEPFTLYRVIALVLAVGAVFFSYK